MVAKCSGNLECGREKVIRIYVPDRATGSGMVLAAPVVVVVLGDIT